MKPSRSILSAWGLSILPFVFLACNASGGTEAGNFRTIRGDLSGSQSTLIVQSGKHADVSCVADSVVATNAQGQETRTDVTSGCFFELGLAIDAAYQLRLEKAAALVATFEFDHNAEYLSPRELILSQGRDPIDLGEITIAMGLATPENQPAAQNDQDQDGLSDYDDLDDDGDGILDDEEPDCDENGIPDDYDPSSTCLGL